MSAPTAAGDNLSSGLTIKTTSRSSAAGSTTVRTITSKKSVDGGVSSTAPDWMKPDIKWANKYLTNDQPRSPRISPSRQSVERMSPSVSISISTTERTREYEAPTVARTMRRTEQDLDFNPTRRHSASTANGWQHLNGAHHGYRSVSPLVVNHSGTYRSSNYGRAASSDRGRSPVMATVVTPPSGSYSNYRPTGNSGGAYSSSQTSSTLNPTGQISHTRRKIRKLVCQTRGDPHYYDY